MPPNAGFIGRSQVRAFGIVPAAGRSRRMGTAKLLLPWGDATVIESVVAAWRASVVEAVCAVVSPEDVWFAEICRRAGAVVIVPGSPPPDMKDSLRAGVEHIERTFRPVESDCILVAPADMPWIEAGTISRLVEAFASSEERVVVPVCEGRRGHPVVLGWSVAREVFDLADDESLKTIIQRLPARTVESAETVLGDLDTREDYEAARVRFAK